MKSKQEVIQEAWGETVYPGLDMDMKSWDEGKVWYEHWKKTGKVYLNFLNDQNKRLIHLRDDVINLNGWFWPKSLDGIETNNGWTIADVTKLPTEGKYNVGYFLDDGTFHLGNDEVEWYELREYVSCLGFTHYQPIIKPQAPIY